MNTAAVFSRGIKSHGRDFLLNSNQILRGFLPADGPAQFLPDAVIAPGDVLQDQAEGKRYIVADTAAADGYLAVYLKQFHIICSISRAATALNAFGRVTEDPFTVADGVPIAFKPGSKQAVISAGTQCKSGDVLHLETAGIYTVNSVTGECAPGLLLLAVTKQNNNSLAAAMF